jgi:AcrR family transcriptional regulator
LAVADVAERQHTDDRQSKILDAVGEIVLERGIHGLTTALVARRARVAPGKFYELYSDKYAVIAAAADRNLNRFFDALVEAFDGSHDVDFVEMGRVTIDIWIDFCRRDPAFRVLRFQHAADVAAAEEPDDDARVVRAWANFVSSHLGIEDTAELRRTMTLAVKFVLDPIEYAFEVDPDGDPSILAQVRKVLDFHLASA